MTIEERINELMCLSKYDLARMIAESEQPKPEPAEQPQ